MSDDWAILGGRLAMGVAEVTHDAASLDTSGFWVVVQTFEGRLTCVRMADVRPLGALVYAETAYLMRNTNRTWESSIEREGYVKGVETIRERIAAGDVYQVNLCRMLSTERSDPPDMRALGAALARHNPAPYASSLSLPSADLFVASASPELFLRRQERIVESGPIKGTGRTADDLTDKDVAENVMIVDLVRNDLSRVCEPGSVTVPSLLATEQHPGLVHLVSTVRGTLRPDIGWSELLDATSPPGSVSGAPKESALHIIRELEPTPRGVYCGAVGWVDADTQTGVLAVGIRTFEWRDGRLHLGTGAGITWGSEPAREWDETELKVSRLLEVL